MKLDFFLRRIREEFPEIEWKNCRYLTRGWDHAVVILDSKTVFRAPKDSRYINRLKNEIQLLRYLKEKVKVGIPEYNCVSRDGSFAGYSMLMGRKLTASVFRRMNVFEKEIVAKQLAEFVTALHSTPMSTIKRFHVKIDKQQKLYRELVRDTKKILFPLLNRLEVQLVQQYFVELKKALNHKSPSVLAHNDLSSEHILWDAKNKQINIIDFSDRSFGDPANDFTGFFEYGLKFTKRVFDLYGGEKDNHILERSQLYFKGLPIHLMKDSLLGFPCTFKQGYTMFLKRFKA